MVLGTGLTGLGAGYWPDGAALLNGLLCLQAAGLEGAGYPWTA